MLALLLFGLSGLATSGPVSGVEVCEAHYVMGTLLEITLVAPDRPTGQRWIRAGVTEARRLDGELTSWSSQSALSRLNAAAGKGVQPVPADVFRVIERSGALFRATGGAFDISVNPLLRLWSRAAEAGRWPRTGEIESSREQVGYEKVALHPPAGIALDAGMSLDLGGIGKGYAVDRIVAILRKRGVDRALVNFGGSSMYAIGAAPGLEAWPVWVSGAEPSELSPLALHDRALSTSGSLGRTRLIDGHLVGDLIDPRSGLPVAERRLAIVLAPSATDAEAWSTALVVSPETTLAVLHTLPDYEARLVRPSRGKVAR